MKKSLIIVSLLLLLTIGFLMSVPALEEDTDSTWLEEDSESWSEISQIDEEVLKEGGLITDDIGEWIFLNGEIINSSSEGCFPENFTSYFGFYLIEERVAASVLNAEFPSDIDNEIFLEQFVKCLVKQDIDFETKEFSGNTYFYAELPQTSFSSDGTTRTVDLDHNLWYNGNRLIYPFYEQEYSAQGEELLTAYFDKYPSELEVGSPGFFQRIIDFFRRLFGG